MRAYHDELPASIHPVGKDQTQSIERNQLDLRTRIKQLARRTICFSACQVMHETVIGSLINQLFFKLNVHLQGMTGQPGILDAQVTVNPPEAILTVEHHHSLSEIQHFISTVGSFHVMDTEAAPPNIHEHDHSASPASANTLLVHHRQVNQLKPTVNATNESAAEQQALQNIGHNGHNEPGSPEQHRSEHGTRSHASHQHGCGVDGSW